MTSQADVVDQLVALGFSQYEARTYLGLVGKPAMTGYALSNATQVPQPKVYETLRRLEEKRAVHRIGHDPARFVAISPEQLLDRLDERFRGQLAEAKEGLSELAQESAHDELHVFEGQHSWAAIASSAARAIQQARRHVYVSARAEELADLREVVLDADARGVQVDVLCFGRSSLRLEHGRVLTHSSTEGVIYRHHQARHLALVADNATSLWALAPDGEAWDSLMGTDPMLTSVVKGYIRHDAYVQQIYADFRQLLDERYGPGLESLSSRLTGPVTPRSAEQDKKAPPTRPTNRRGRLRRPA